MDSNKIKKIIIVSGFGGAILLFGLWALKGLSGNIKDIESVPKGETVWVKCFNPACGSSYEMNLREYYKQAEQKLATTRVPPLVCKKCGKDSIYRAIKCKNCSEVFSPYSGSKTVRDRCPKCGFSETDSPSQR